MTGQITQRSRLKFQAALGYLISEDEPKAIEFKGENQEIIQCILIGRKLFCLGESALMVDLMLTDGLSQEVEQLVISAFSAKEEALVKPYAEYFLELFQNNDQYVKINHRVDHDASIKLLDTLVIGLE